MTWLLKHKILLIVIVVMVGIFFFPKEYNVGAWDDSSDITCIGIEKDLNLAIPVDAGRGKVCYGLPLPI
jgi:hypothetical protein